MNELPAMPDVEPVTTMCDTNALEVEPSLLDVEFSVGTASGKHHPMGMSAWPALLACNAFEKAPYEASEYTGRGKAVHRLVDAVLNERTIDATALSNAMPPEDLETAQWFAQWTMDSGLPWQVEKRVKFNSGPLAGVYGTADLICFHEGVIHVADFKTFSRADDAVDSFPQLAGYALAFAQGLPNVDDCAPVELTILHGGVKRWEKRRMSLDECAQTALELTALVDAAKRGDYRHSVSAHCKYCRHQGACPGCRDIVKAAVVDTSNALCIIGRTREELVADPALAARVCLVAKTVKEYVERIEELAKEVAEAHGGIIEDAENGIKYGFRATSGRRTCRDAAALFHGPMHKMGAENFLKLCKPGFSDCSRELKALMEAEGVKTTVKAVEFMLDPYFERGEGSRQFVRMK